MSAIALGPLMIRADVVVFVMSAVTAYIVLKLRFRGRVESQWMMDTYLNVLIIGFVVWKFSMILFDPVRTIQNPLSLLYFTGGEKGVLLGTASALLYIGVRLNKKRSLTIPLVKAAALAYLAASCMKYVFLWVWMDTSEGINLMYVLLYGFFTVLVWVKFNGSIRQFTSFALWFSIVSVFIPFFSPDRSIVIAGFSSIQIVHALLAIILLIIDMFIHKRKPK